MTPDEFDQKRRELIAMRMKYADRSEVTSRINNLLGQMQAWQGYPVGRRPTELATAITRSLAELSQLTADQ